MHLTCKKSAIGGVYKWNLCLRPGQIQVKPFE